MPNPTLSEQVITPEERGLMVACLTWQPKRGSLESDPRVQAWLAANPGQERTIHILQLILLQRRTGNG